ncbi:hypothetical protein DFJ73DRAFT_966177 [Zopfochytrium polystomum]|nr:hypothetical protein DFJ73DRAFT_966177 [Zopfochytrium polystomum]
MAATGTTTTATSATFPPNVDPFSLTPQPQAPQLSHQQQPFDVCWVGPLNSGLYWSTAVGCTLILYCFSFSARQTLWVVLLAHAVAGLAAVLLETAWLAAVNCDYPAPAWVLGVNEVNWAVHNSAAVLYSYYKTSVILRSVAVQRTVRFLLSALLLAYLTTRGNIAWLRVEANQLWNDDIHLAHTFAFAIWGIADVGLMILLVLCVLDYVGDGGNRQKNGVFMVKTLLQSSIPRFAVIFINTLMLSIESLLAKVADSPRLEAAGLVAGMIKGTYPILLLLDILTTRFLLYRRVGGDGDGDSPSDSDHHRHRRHRHHRDDTPPAAVDSPLPPYPAPPPSTHRTPGAPRSSLSSSLASSVILAPGLSPPAGASQKHMSDEFFPGATLLAMPSVVLAAPSRRGGGGGGGNGGGVDAFALHQQYHQQQQQQVSPTAAGGGGGGRPSFSLSTRSRSRSPSSSEVSFASTAVSVPSGAAGAGVPAPASGTEEWWGLLDPANVVVVAANDRSGDRRAPPRPVQW